MTQSKLYILFRFKNIAEFVFVCLYFTNVFSMTLQPSWLSIFPTILKPVLEEILNPDSDEPVT